MSREATGGCLCGAIRYRVALPNEDLRACHCTHCQKASGAGGSVNTIVPTSAVTFVQGAPKRYVDTAQSGNKLYRFFCETCGSPIYSQRETAPEFMVLRAGSLDDSSPMRITGHIWTASARPWSHIDPGLPAHPAGVPLK